MSLTEVISKQTRRATCLHPECCTASSQYEGLITFDECTIALKKMKYNKSPGLDGITTEFYQAFWPLLGNFLVEVYNECYEEGILPDSQRQAVLSLI